MKTRYTPLIAGLFLASLLAAVSGYADLASPNIATQPTNQVLALGGDLQLSVSVTGTEPMGYQWFKNGGLLAGSTQSTLLRAGASVIDSGVYTVAITNAFGMRISTPVTVTVGNPHLLVWGRNNYGQLGCGMITDRQNPIAVSSHVVTAAAGFGHTLYLKGDGELWAMGLNSDGELGDGSTLNRSNAVSVASNVVTVCAGNLHSLFIKSDGTMWVMGARDAIGVATNPLLPLPVASNVVLAVAGISDSLFLKDDGTLWGMGRNDYGQLGNGNNVNQSKAISVADHVVAVSAGGYHTLFLKGDGTMWAMGQNTYGQLGDGTTLNRSNAVFVASNVTAMAGGYNHSLFVKNDGTLWAAGQNDMSQLGDGTTLNRSNAVCVASNVVSVAAGWQHSLFMTSDATVWAMGFNVYGQLGDGTTTLRRTPVSVPFKSMANIISGNEAHHTLAVGEWLPPVITRSPTNQTVVAGSNASFTVVADGLAPLAYQWCFNDLPISGATATNYMLTGVTAAQAGGYTVVVSNSVGSVTSSVAVLTVTKTSQAINFSALAPQPVAATVALVATASSGLPVSFSVVSGPGLITGQTNLTFSGPGTLEVVASQAGDAFYGAAPDVTNQVAVYAVTPDNGPLAGGNTITLTSGALGIVTGVQVGGLAAAIQGSDTNLILTLPAHASSGLKDIVVETADHGAFTLLGAYTVNPAGSIGSSRLEPTGWEGLGSGLSGSSVSALVHDGTSLYAGGDFMLAGGVSANRVAQWNGEAWTNLGVGVSGRAVYALAHDGANLYAGGDFTNAGGVAANYVAMWNGTAWTNLSSGLNGSVRALALDGQSLYAGGTFTIAGGVAANYVAMWNGTVWTNLDSGVDSWVRALAHDGTNLVVGGYFTGAGGVAANHVAQWDGTSWEPLGNGLNYVVRALTFAGSNLVAGGDFTTAGNGAANAVALWNGNAWSALGSGMSDSVTALVYDGVNLVAGGNFTTAEGLTANHVAQWDGAGWTALGSGMSAVVKALAHDGTDLYAGGDFTVAGGVSVSHVAVWGETRVALSGVAPANGGQAGGYAVTISGTDLCNGSDVSRVTLCGVEAFIQSQSATQLVVIAGTAGSPGLGDVRVLSTSFGETVKTNAFTYLADQTISFAALPSQPLASVVGLSATASSGLPVAFRVVSGPGSIADLTNLTFSAAGCVVVAASQTGDALYGAAPDVTNRIYVYTVSPDTGPIAGGNSVSINTGDLAMITNVYVGGVGAVLQGIAAEGLLLTMPATGSTGLKDIVLQTSGHGDFTLANAYTVNPAGQIGGTTPGPHVWAALGAGLPESFVYAFAHAETNLYAGGTFSLGDEAAAHVAMWDGQSWTGLGSGVNDTVTALAYNGTTLYVGGYFTTAGGMSANYVAMWDGTSWTSLGSGLNGPVSALLCDGTDLYAGGAFTTAGGVPANRVAMWTGTEWVGLGSGMVGASVTALAHDGTYLYAGGNFTKAGGLSANRVARWDGASWTALGSGMNDMVYALEVDGASLFAGGAFTIAGGVAANRVARWNGVSWTSLGNGLNNTVSALSHNGTQLYAGGSFTLADGVAANYVAVWDGASWTGLDTGVNSSVRALTHDGVNLYVGSILTVAGGEADGSVKLWKPTVITYPSVTPESGFLSGGYPVTISGMNLCNGSDVTNVTLCGVSAIVLSQSATQIVVTAGVAATVGLGDARVYSVAYGETVKADAFTYLAAPLIWNPQIQGGGDFGIQANQFGFTISGSTNLVVVIEACTNLVNPVWIPLQTNTLTDGVFYFSDPAWTNYSSRFYRLLQP
jgi:alpha-tubulin suppressor-like RCC1 family protein